jgi:hypothetical protein
VEPIQNMSREKIQDFLINFHAAVGKQKDMPRFRRIVDSFRSQGVFNVLQLVESLNSFRLSREDVLSIFGVGLSPESAIEIFEALEFIKSHPNFTVFKAVQYLQSSSDDSSQGGSQLIAEDVEDGVRKSRDLFNENDFKEDIKDKGIKGQGKNKEVKVINKDNAEPKRGQKGEKKVRSKELSSSTLSVDGVPNMKELLAEPRDYSTDVHLGDLNFDDYSSLILRAIDTNKVYNKELLWKQGICFDFVKSVSTGGKCTKGSRCRYHHSIPSETLAKNLVSPSQEAKVRNSSMKSETKVVPENLPSPETREEIEKEEDSVATSNESAVSTIADLSYDESLTGKIANPNAIIGLHATSVTVCFSYANHGECKNACCPFVHDPFYTRPGATRSRSNGKSPTGSLRSKQTNNHSVSDSLNVCYDFINKGVCMRDRCNFAHPSPGESVPFSSLQENRQGCSSVWPLYPTSLPVPGMEREKAFAQPIIPQSRAFEASSNSNNLGLPLERYHNNGMVQTPMTKPSTCDPFDSFGTNNEGPASISLETPFGRSLMTSSTSAAHLSFVSPEDSKELSQLSMYLGVLLNK